MERKRAFLCAYLLIRHPKDDGCLECGSVKVSSLTVDFIGAAFFVGVFRLKCFKHLDLVLLATRCFFVN